MSENGEKCWSLFPKDQGDVLSFKCYVQNTKIFILLPLKGLQKPENIHIWEAKLRKIWTFFKKNDELIITIGGN